MLNGYFLGKTIAIVVVGIVSRIGRIAWIKEREKMMILPIAQCCIYFYKEGIKKLAWMLSYVSKKRGNKNVRKEAIRNTNRGNIYELIR